MISNILFFIIIVILIALIYFKLIKQKRNNVDILSKERTLSILLSNNDNYYSKFSDLDLKVRKVQNVNEYKNKIKNCVCEPEKIIKNKILKAVDKADYKLNKLISIHNGNYKHIDLNKLHNIKWKIGFVCNNDYEQGLPHTRNDLIIMPIDMIYSHSINNLSETLIHEKVHVYQKLFPKETENYLKMNNFKKIKKREDSDNIRANPDMDDNIYTDGDIVYKASYLPNAVNITDVRIYNNDQKFEHPHENMAIILADATNHL